MPRMMNSFLLRIKAISSHFGRFGRPPTADERALALIKVADQTLFIGHLRSEESEVLALVKNMHPDIELRRLTEYELVCRKMSKWGQELDELQKSNPGKMAALDREHKRLKRLGRCQICGRPADHDH